MAVVALSVAEVGQATTSTMQFSRFQPAMWDQYHWTNRALGNRCRVKFDGMEEFTSTVPLSDVRPPWRDEKLGYAKRKHHKAQARSSLCWPAHHFLWLCIHSGEGDWEDGGWPYWGGLQMGGWFLETFMGITNPRGVVGPNGWYGAPSQYAQETAAERAYQQNHSVAFLHGQWPNSSPPCSAYY